MVKRIDAVSRIVYVAIVVVIVVVAAAVALYVSNPFAPPPTTTTPPKERLLRVSFANTPYLDPAVGSDEASSTYFVNVYDSLVYPTATGDVKPMVATSWQVSPDGLAWTFKLRSDVKFHSGKTLTADDVVYSLKRLIAIGQGYGYLFAPYVDLDKTVALNSTAVKIVLKKPFGPFLQVLVRLYIVDKDLVQAHEKNGDWGREWLMKGEADAGSGPYKLSLFIANDRAELVKVTNYWGEVAPNAPTKVIMYGTTDPTTIRTLIANRQLEISDQWQPIENLEAMAKFNGVSLAKVPTSSEFYIMLHTKKPPTDDIHVRKALALAFDYDTVINQIFPYSIRANGPVPQSLPGADPDMKPISRNVTAAMEELKKSKYWGKFDQYPIEYWWIAEVPAEERVALLFKQNMEALGLVVNVVKKPWLSVVEGMSKMETAPNAVSIFVAAHYLDAGSILESRYTSKSAGTWEQNEWLLNSTIDSMVENALGIVDKNQRYQEYYKIERIIAEMYPSLFLFDQVTLRVYQSAYVDFPAAKGNVIPILGYELDFRWIQVYPEKIPPPA